VIVYSTSRLSRELFHALAYERELARAGVEVFYARSAGDQTSPEGRLIRHMFQALDQFEVEKLGREVRRGQTENTKQGYRNGGRAPYGYRLRHEPHPDPRRAKAGDQKSRLVAHPEQAPVIAEMFALFLAGSGYKEIADRLNRPGRPSPAPPRRQRIERQLGAIEAGVDPALVGERIRELKAERQEVEAAITQLDQEQRNGEGFDVEEAAAESAGICGASCPISCPSNGHWPSLLPGGRSPGLEDGEVATMAWLRGAPGLRDRDHRWRSSRR
jgi:DNA invertase Pin-like site-specific DNA recombinase